MSLLRDCYLARAEQYGLLSGGKAFFTDRMPFNEVNLPMLKMIFPEARIVHAVRHPLDVCVSIDVEQHDAWVSVRLQDG